MAINKDSNSYTITFAIIMCIVVAALLAVISQSLKPYQDANILNEKKQNILAALGITTTLKEADGKFKEHVKEALILDANGQLVAPKNDPIQEALGINALTEFKDKKAEERMYPLFVCEKEGQKYYVMPVGGLGLWAGIWGYVSVGEDYNTVAGASFDHKSETPGLGAEISTPFFEDQFKGKKMNDEGGAFVSIRVVKPGSPKSDHSVDGISGGTFTSKGVDEMLIRCLSVYNNYFKSLNSTTAIN